MIIIPRRPPLQPNTFDVPPKLRRKRITMFGAAGGWIFKPFFEDSEIFRELAAVEEAERQGVKLVEVEVKF